MAGKGRRPLRMQQVNTNPAFDLGLGLSGDQGAESLVTSGAAGGAAAAATGGGTPAPPVTHSAPRPAPRATPHQHRYNPAPPHHTTPAGGATNAAFQGDDTDSATAPHPHPPPQHATSTNFAHNQNVADDADDDDDDDSDDGRSRGTLAITMGTSDVRNAENGTTTGPTSPPLPPQYPPAIQPPPPTDNCTPPPPPPLSPDGEKIPIDVDNGSRRSRDVSREFHGGDRDMNGHAHALRGGGGGEAGGDGTDLDEEDEEFEETRCTRCTDLTHGALRRAIARHYSKLRMVVIAVLLVCYTVYFTYAIIHDVHGAVALIVLTFLVVSLVLINVMHKHFGHRINTQCCVPMSLKLIKYWNYVKWILVALIVLGLVLFVALDVREDPIRLTSLSGLVLCILIGYCFSKNPSRIRWRPVIWGLVMQWILGLIVLRWPMGLMAIKWFADQIVTFLSYSEEGSRFVFGEAFVNHPFAFQSLPVVIFFSSIIGILYYYGVMQAVVKVMAWLMQVTMGTTAIESLASASNVFVSYVEVAPILVPYIKKLTKSEMHAILTSGFATVAGSILALYIQFGAPAEHLVSACILSAPAALAMAKLSYPETKKSHTRTIEDVELPRGPERNFIEAAANGAMMAIKLVGGIAACLIAFLGIIGFVNSALGWLGRMIGIEELTFQLLCSYLLYPLAIMMGVEVKDAQQVAGMLGWKIFVDEVLCYRDLGAAVKAGQLGERSAVIATYACCGFGSLGAMGVALGAMMAITPPSRRGLITQLILRALVNGNLAAFMTACIAGLLYKGDQPYTFGNVTIGGHSPLNGNELLII